MEARNLQKELDLTKIEDNFKIQTLDNVVSENEESAPDIFVY